MKTFNTAGKCIPSMHYMVDISQQVEAAAKLVRRGNYFCINRGRQYGKTTTLALLKKKLEGEGYAVFSLSFEGLGGSAFKSDESLLYVSIQLMQSKIEWNNVKNLSPTALELLQNFKAVDNREISSVDYSKFIAKLCTESKMVLLIDEVDAVGNHVEFIKFLGLLREMYLNRDDRPTFQSVILAGVYDIKNLKLKLRPEDQHQYNSPWNIAVPFETNMSLPADGIAGMLAEYKADHHLDFDEHFIGQMIYDYTSGYPFLVSRICQIIDEGGLTWDREGVLKAIDRLLIQSNALFWEILDIVDDYPQLKQKLGDMLEQQKIKCTSDEDFYIIGVSFGFLDKKNGIISCPIFESLFSMCLGVKKIA